MIRRRQALLVAAGACAWPVARAGQDNAIGAAMNDLRVRVERDVPYGDHPRQRFDAYLPAAAAGPVLLVVHGGGWTRGDKRSPALILPKVRYWTARGFVVVAVNYRLLPDAHPLEQAGDVARALARVQAKAAGWRADPRRAILMGHSSGAHLVALLGAEPARAREQDADPVRGTICLDTAAYDVPALMAGPHAAVYDHAFGRHAAYWRTVSPLHVLSRDASPLLAICSRRRGNACAQSHAFAARAAHHGVRVQVQELDLGHAEIGRQLGLPGSYTDSVDRWISAIL